MPVTPGSASKLNRIAGVATVMYFTAAELTALGSVVFDKGILLVDPDGKTYRTDGVTALNALTPIVDQVLIAREKTALMNTFTGTGGTYAPAEGGFLMLGENGRMGTCDVLPADFYDQSTGKVLLNKLPDSVRAGVTYVADIAARDALPNDGEAKRGMVFVVDASADPQTANGAAMYAWVDNPEYTGTEDQTHPAKVWQMIAEVESLNLDIDALTPSYRNVQAAGAVMYDHTVFVEAPTLTQFNTLAEAAESSGE